MCSVDFSVYKKELCVCVQPYTCPNALRRAAVVERVFFLTRKEYIE